MLATTKGFLAVILAILNVLIMAIPFFSVVALKIILPGHRLKAALTTLITALARQYNRNNAAIFKAMSNIQWDVTGVNELSQHGSYLVVANHQSWADIPVLQSVMERHAPLLKFFLKKELIWVPVLGAAWWALDFPFMKRYSREYLARHPEKRGEDLVQTRRMCERFKTMPVSVMNFLEGTRFTPEKKARQQSPYQHLLKPKAGGAALVISSMGKSVNTLVDVTIDYDVDGNISIWKLFSGQVERIHVHVETIEIPEHFFESDNEKDASYRQEFKDWIDAIWTRKDHLLSRKSRTRQQDLVIG